MAILIAAAVILAAIGLVARARRSSRVYLPPDNGSRWWQEPPS